MLMGGIQQKEKNDFGNTISKNKHNTYFSLCPR